MGAEQCRGATRSEQGQSGWLPEEGSDPSQEAAGQQSSEAGKRPGGGSAGALELEQEEIRGFPPK